MVSWRVPFTRRLLRSIRLAASCLSPGRLGLSTESDFTHRLDRGKSPTPMESLTSASGCGHNLRVNDGIFE